MRPPLTLRQASLRRHAAGVAFALSLLASPALAQGPAEATPAPPALGPELLLSVADLAADPLTGRLTLPAAKLPAPASALPLVDPADDSPGAALLRHLAATARVAGLAGVVYDNRDRGHSRFPSGAFPALTRTVYGPVLRIRGLDFGPAGAFRLPAITFGNSSTAITAGPIPRSLARLEMTTPDGPWTAWGDYSANALYVYPCHHDNDAWDLYPAAWPYRLSSQGSSGTDQPFLRAIAAILAAFRPETRARMEALGLVAPTVTMVFRRAQTGVAAGPAGRAAYLSGAAHPSAFAKGSVNLTAMIALAQSLAPDAIPPLVRLAVEEEDFRSSAGLLDRSERLYDTPSAIARLWRGRAWEHRMVVSAAATTDPSGRALRFSWVLLRGDPARVKIEPLDAEGTRARITLDWQEPRPAPAGFTTPGPGPMSDRVDIGVFADNGAVLSAPAFVSVAFPAQQIRRYEAGPDGTMRLAETDYDGNARGTPYDPLLWWSAPWRDVYRYDAAGKLAGWTRETTRTGGPPPQEFGADGAENGTRPVYRLVKPGADLGIAAN